ncbi:hypothetical protein JYU34_002447 [Plutella xylostella]|uniref:Uncharacterized protein n=1 Tax=Plutella xylostella TaxID=51655 RepID=A0ABQ7R283_PLUXY|nr:hypothetical protein JYU34_002447 [Plutella xylostella]
MRGQVRRGGCSEAARALHRLAFALWRAAFHLQRGPRAPRRSRSAPSCYNRKYMVRSLPRVPRQL